MAEDACNVFHPYTYEAIRSAQFYPALVLMASLTFCTGFSRHRRPEGSLRTRFRRNPDQRIRTDTDPGSQINISKPCTSLTAFLATQIFTLPHPKRSDKDVGGIAVRSCSCSLL